MAKLDASKPQRLIDRQALSLTALAIGWVALLSWIGFGWQLGSVGLVDETEPLFAEAARQMVETGDWVTPYFNGVTRFDKPPLVYWLMAVGFHLFGVSEWTVRLPSALSAAGLTGFGFYVLRRFGQLAVGQRPGAALWTAVVGAAAIALNPETIAWARIGVSDMLLSACVGSALLSFFLGYAQPEYPHRQAVWYYAGYVFMALAVLAKGPVGLVLPGLTIISFLLYLGKLREGLRELRLLRGGLLFLAIALPWFILVTLANGEAYLDSFFGYHNFQRFTSVVNRHAAPWFFYFLVVTIGFLPWSGFLPLAIFRLKFWRVQHWRRLPRSQHLGLFALIWFAVVFLFFTASVTKLPSYVLPLMPAAGILVGLTWSDYLSQPRRLGWGFWASAWANIALFLGLSAIALYSPNWMGNDPTMPNLPHLARASGIFTRAAVIWGMAAIAGCVLVILRRAVWLWSVNLIAIAAFVLLTIMPAFQLADSLRQQPLQQIATAVAVEQQRNEPVVMVGFMKPSLVFYSQRRVNYIGDPAAVAGELADSPSDSFLLVGHPEEVAATLQPGQTQEVLLQKGTYQLARVHR